MFKLKYVLVFSVFIASLNDVVLAVNVVKDNCSTLEACFEKIEDVANRNSGRGFGAESAALSLRIIDFGDRSVVKGLPLLKNKNENAVDIIAYAFRGMESIDSKHLTDILDILNATTKSSWLDGALGRIAHPLAAEESVKRFLDSGSTGNQKFYAVKLQAAQAVPFILAAAKCEYACDDDTHRLLGQAILELDVASKAVISKELIDFVLRSELEDELVRKILSIYWSVGKTDANTEEKLISLMEKSPHLKLQVEHALVGIYSKQTGEIFSKWLQFRDFDPQLLHQISSRASVAYDAGPELIKLLNVEDKAVVNDVINLLGKIGYTEGAEHILSLLINDNDIFMNASAIEALGNLKSVKARPELVNVMELHWYPPIRSLAKIAVEQIDGVSIDVISENISEQIIPTLGLWGWELELCKKITKLEVKEPKSIKLYKSHAGKQLESLSINTEIVGFTAFDEDEQVAEAESKGENAIVEVNSSNMIEVRTPIVRIPHVALKVKDGWLVGTANGEWGGDLAYVDKDNTVQRIFGDNVEDIYRLGDRYFVVAGTSHFGLSDGSIYEVSLENNKWVSQKRHSLPGVPFSSWLVESGEVLVNTQGGNILLSEEGTLSMAECVQ